jgi:hypothetical protein
LTREGARGAVAKTLVGSAPIQVFYKKKVMVDSLSHNRAKIRCSRKGTVASSASLYNYTEELAVMLDSFSQQSQNSYSLVDFFIYV